MVAFEFCQIIFPILQAQQIPYTGINPKIFEPFGSGEEVKSGLSNILLLGAIAFFLFNIIRYMASKAFSDEQSVVRAKADMYDNIAVALLITGLWIGLQAVEYVSATAYPRYFDTETGPVGMLNGYIIPTIAKYMYLTHDLAAMKAQSANVKASAMLQSTSIGGIPITGPLFNFMAFNQVNKLLFESEMNADLSIGLSVALAAINYIKDGAGYFLMFGLCARIFPPFRGIGAFLICSALGFYYIYPLTTAMFLFGIPQISLNEGTTTDTQCAFCTMRATGAFVLPQQDLSSGMEISLGEPQTLQEEFGIILSTNFLLSQIVALSLTAMFISNGTLVLGKGLFTSVGVGDLLRRII